MTSKVVPEERGQEGSGRSYLSAIISSEEADRIEFVAVIEGARDKRTRLAPRGPRRSVADSLFTPLRKIRKIRKNVPLADAGFYMSFLPWLRPLTRRGG